MVYAPIPGSTAWYLWAGYLQFAVTNLDHLPGSFLFLGKYSGNIPAATMAVVAFAPQMLIATVGGLLTWALGFAIERWHQRKHLAHPAMREVLGNHQETITIT
jgi:hypothetical protein